MVSNLSVIVPCYNKVEGVIAVVEWLLVSDKYSKIVLLDLYSPDKKTRDYIASIAELYEDKILLIDPKKKLSLSDWLNLASSYIEGEYIILNDYKKDETKIQEVISTPVVQKATINPYAFKTIAKRDKRFIAPGRYKWGNSF